MPVSIDIVPISETLDMYGEVDASAAYSLAGHVSIAITSLPSLFDGPKTTRIMLHSVTLIFEGQNEVLNRQTGYSSVRLCSVKREIIPSEQAEMSNMGHESGDPCIWNVIFDLPVPGWLPPSSTYGIEQAGTRYTLFAKAKFTSVNEANRCNTFLFSAFRSRIKSLKSIKTQKLIPLRRFVCHPDDQDPTAPLPRQMMNYVVDANNLPGRDRESKFPQNVLSKIEVLASAPEHVDIEHKAFPFTLRIRTQGLGVDDCKRIRVASFSANVIQKEVFRTCVTSNYARRFPLPPPSHQPPVDPLSNPHSVPAIYNLGYGNYAGMADQAGRSFSLLPPGITGTHTFSEDNYPFIDCTDTSGKGDWYTFESTVPFVCQAMEDDSEEWAGKPMLLPSVISPLVTICHEVAIEVVCTYDVTDTDSVASERLLFSVPLQLSSFAPRQCLHAVAPPLIQTFGVPFSPTPLPSSPHLSNLPAYSQLFYSNGDRKVDHTVPLPLYAPVSSFDLSSPPEDFLLQDLISA